MTSQQAAGTAENKEDLNELAEKIARTRKPQKAPPKAQKIEAETFQADPAFSPIPEPISDFDFEMRVSGEGERIQIQLIETPEYTEHKETETAKGQDLEDPLEKLKHLQLNLVFSSCKNTPFSKYKWRVHENSQGKKIKYMSELYNNNATIS